MEDEMKKVYIAHPLRGGTRDINAIYENYIKADALMLTLAGKHENEEILETFLGGMETGEGRRLTGGEPPLETFLGGMETGSGPPRHRERSTLETFLGGMETVCLAGSFRVPMSLETFLGGMETPVFRCLSLLNRPLKPSLVEWKPLQGR